LSSSMVPPPPPSTLFPYTTLFRSPRTSWRGWTRRTARTSPHAPGSPSSASSRSWRRSHDRSARLGLPVPDVAGGVGGEHALDEGGVLLHVVPQELGDRLVPARPVVVELLRVEGDVGLGCVELRGVEEAEDAAHARLHDRGADAAGGGPDDAGRLLRERVLPPRPRPPVDRVLQRAGDRAVVLRGDEEDAVRRL